MGQRAGSEMCFHHAHMASATGRSPPGTNCASSSRCLASTVRTISTHGRSLLAKWWISIRWLVPMAAASVRRLTSESPFCATYSIARRVFSLVRCRDPGPAPANPAGSRISR